MPDDIWKGGIGALIFGICAYFLFPMLKASTEASANRAGTDSTLHELYQNLLVAYAKASEESAKSAAAVIGLTESVKSLEAKLTASQEREEKLSHEVNGLRREVSALTDALAAARGERHAVNQA